MKQQYLLQSQKTPFQAGFFLNDASGNNDAVASKLKRRTYNYTADIAVGKITFARNTQWEDAFKANNFIGNAIYVQYITGAPASLIYTMSSPIDPLNNTATALMIGGTPIPLGGVAGNPSKYTVQAQNDADGFFSIVPNAGILATDVPAEIYIVVTSLMRLYNPATQQFQIESIVWAWEAINPNYITPATTSTIFNFTLPSWVSNPFWAQSLYALGANLYLTQFIALSTIFDPTTSFAPLILPGNFLVDPNFAALSTMSSTAVTEGPSAIVQFQLSILDLVYSGAMSADAIFVQFVFMPKTVNAKEFDYDPAFIETTQQTVSNAGIQKTWNVSIEDQFSNVFFSFVASYDFIATVIQWVADQG